MSHITFHKIIDNKLSTRFYTFIGVISEEVIVDLNDILSKLNSKNDNRFNDIKASKPLKKVINDGVTSDGFLGWMRMFVV